MKKKFNRRYKTKRERENMLRYSTGRMSKMRIELAEKNNSKYGSKVVRETTFFKLTALKEGKVYKHYTLEDVKNKIKLPLTKEQVKESELAIGTGQDFNEAATEIFKNK